MLAQIGRTAAIGLAAVAIVIAAATADELQRNAAKAWKSGDKCAQDAFQKYPDYTPESNAKREAARQACLRNHRFPYPSGVPPTPATTQTPSQ